VSDDDALSLFSPEPGADDQDPVPLPRSRPRTISGWLVGIVVGVLIGLWWFPEVRYTLSAQLQLALVQESAAWVRVMDSRRIAMERPHLDAAAASAPNDYLLQVGRATALVEMGGVREPSSGPLTEADYVNDRSLLRLGVVARDFPSAPGAYAHLARYMMVDRVRIQRQELSTPPSPNAPDREEGRGKREETSSPMPNATVPNASAPLTRSIPARHRDVRLMEWALRSGEERDPDNAFWPAMRAITYFAAMRDEDGLRALARASHKPLWDAYIYEEVLGQWRLYSTAYGDIGATQKIGPLSLIAFPHLREIRTMAQIARWHAERAAAEGHDRDAIRIRHDIARLGRIMRDTAQWAIEALYGTDLILIADTDSSSPLVEATIQDTGQWEQQAQNYLALLRRMHRPHEISWLYDEVAASCALRQRVDVARFDASYPGTPPGIPLIPLFGNWMVGIFLIQEMAAMAVAALLAHLWYRRASPIRTRLARTVCLGLLVSLTITAWLFIFSIQASPRVAIGMLIGLTLLLLFGLNALSRWLYRGSASAPATDLRSAGADVEAQWKWGTTATLLCTLLLPGLIALYLLRPQLSGLHPVAALLTGLTGTPPMLTAQNALGIGLLGCALPLAFCLASALWAFLRRLSPLAGALVGLRRMALPALACLALAYLLMLSRTLRLDNAASHAINEVAQNERQWVLTHSAADPYE
jgi:hypothetical protein